MTSAKLLASAIATAFGILILESLLRFARDHPSALILGALCLNSSINTLAEWCEKVGGKPKLDKLDFVNHLFYSVATVACSCLEFLKISGYEGLLGKHFKEVPFFVAVAIPVLVLIELLILLINHMISKRAAAASGPGDLTSINIDSSGTPAILGGAAIGAIRTVTHTWTTEGATTGGAVNGANLTTLTFTTANGLTVTLTAYRISLTVSEGLARQGSAENQ